MKRLFTLLLLLLAFQGFAQDIKRTNTWYFGKYAGLSFSTTPPTTLTNSVMNTYEGPSSISDTAGNLLFYTEGTQVWNKNHQLMPNGTGLNGNASAHQGSIVIPKPGSDNIYYLFTTDMQGQSKGLCYHVIDMSLNGGLGDITSKNIKIATSVCEAISATYHANGKDIWLLSHGYGNSSYYAFLITNEGVKPCPVVTSLGTNIYGDPLRAQGTIRFSNSGDFVITTVFVADIVQLLDFNKTSGVLTNLRSINNLYTVISAQFAPNDKVLYISLRDVGVHQFDISSGNESVINNSKKNISIASGTRYYGLQLASDGKIYINLGDSTFLSRINNPNNLDSACNFEHKAVLLSNKGLVCLPNFITSYFAYDSILNFTYKFQCPSQQAVLSARNYQTTPQWTITKQSSAGSWMYNGGTVTHTFDSGTYAVKLKAGTDSVTKTITVGWSGELLPSSDTTRCQTDSVLLTIRNPQFFSCIKWNDTISSDAITAKTNETYRVSAWNMQGCKLTDSIRVRLFATPPDPLVKPMPDTILFCKGNSIALTPDSGAGFHWQDGYPFASRIIDTTGLFYTSWTDSFTCQRGDTTRLIFYPITSLQNPLADSVTFCIGQTVTLNPDSGSNFHWQDNYPNATRIIDSAGLFFTNWFDTNGCRMADSILVKTYSVTKPAIQQSGDSLFAFGNFNQWQWYYTSQLISGATLPKYKAAQNGWYKVWGRDLSQCFATSDSIQLTNVFVYEPLLTSAMMVFPNPVNGMLHIRLQKATDQLTGLQLYSSTGQLVYCETSPNPSEVDINCSALPKGLYLLTVSVNQKTYTRKILIK